jgi:hypothetical protein
LGGFHVTARGSDVVISARNTNERQMKEKPTIRKYRGKYRMLVNHYNFDAIKHSVQMAADSFAYTATEETLPLVATRLLAKKLLPRLVKPEKINWRGEWSFWIVFSDVETAVLSVLFEIHYHSFQQAQMATISADAADALNSNEEDVKRFVSLRSQSPSYSDAHQRLRTEE